MLHRRTMTLDSHNERQIRLEDLIECPAVDKSILEQQKAHSRRKILIDDNFEIEARLSPPKSN